MRPSKRTGGQAAGRASNRANIWAALVTVWIVWGTTYLAIAVTVRSLPPLLAAGLRFLLAGSLLYVWAIRRGDREGDRPTGMQWDTRGLRVPLRLRGGRRPGAEGGARAGDRLRAA